MYEASNLNKNSIVVGLGNFDGVHIGHQKLLSELISLAEKLNKTPVVMTFDPHPQQVLNAQKSPLMLLSRDEKEKKIREQGIDSIIWLPFTRELAVLSPEDFVAEILVARYNCAGVVVGYDYTFGAAGQGTAETMRNFGNKHGFEVLVVPPVGVGNFVVSSTAIRDFMIQGDIDEAATLLGYHPSVQGQVVSGDKRGSAIGFPTANLDIPEGILVPGNGVYAVKVIVDEKIHTGVLNIGVRPTFYEAQSARNMEVHLLDFQGDLYGKTVEMVFMHRIRDEKTFSSVDQLVGQINEDIKVARHMICLKASC